MLVGLPGSGKSTVGPLLARRLDCSFVDLDTQIEHETGLAVSEIFARRGESEFRRIESELTARLASQPDLVLSAGGGWMLHNMLPNALTVWLQVDPDEAAMRLSEHAARRPLLQPDPLQRLQELLAERAPVYERADVHLNTNGKTPAAVADEIAAALEM